jgi:outer membrane lipoprotein-sorting protein
MKVIISITFVLIATFSFGQYPDGKELLEKIDDNMSSDSRIFTSTMVIHGRRGSRNVESKTWAEGEDNSYTEYLAPAREEGTKMLKQEDMLWMYSPSTDRTIKISGHMLRQSVMGSDLSYEDMLDDKKMTESYDAVVTAEEEYNGTTCWVIDLKAKTDDLAYDSRKIWVDKEKFVPMKQELFAKSGKLLKRMEMSDVVRVEGRWYPRKMTFKDMLKDGKGTEFIVTEIQFDIPIPADLLNKGSLKK